MTLDRDDRQWICALVLVVLKTLISCTASATVSHYWRTRYEALLTDKLKQLVDTAL